MDNFWRHPDEMWITRDGVVFGHSIGSVYRGRWTVILDMRVGRDRMRAFVSGLHGLAHDGIARVTQAIGSIMKCG